MNSNYRFYHVPFCFMLAISLFIFRSASAEVLAAPRSAPIIPLFVDQKEVMIIEHEGMGSNTERTEPAHHVCIRLLEIKEEPFSGLLCLANWLGASDDVWLLRTDKSMGTKYSVYYTGYKLSDVLPERAVKSHQSYYKNNNIVLNNLCINKIEHGANNSIFTMTISLSFTKTFRVYFKDRLMDGIININLDDILLDTDMDGLTDLAENKLGTSAMNKDSDQDGIIDTFDNNPMTPIGNNMTSCALYENAIRAIIVDMKIIDLPIPIAVIRLDSKETCSFELFQPILFSTNLPIGAFIDKTGYDTFVFIGIDQFEIVNNTTLAIKAFISATGKKEGLYNLLLAKDNGKWSLKKRHRFHY